MDFIIVIEFLGLLHIVNEITYPDGMVPQILFTYVKFNWVSYHNNHYLCNPFKSISKQFWWYKVAETKQYWQKVKLLQYLLATTTQISF